MEETERMKLFFIDARNLGIMETRALKVLTDEDIQKIQNTVTSWRKDDGYQDVKGFCKSSTFSEIQKNNYLLTPGRYVGLLDDEEDGLSFEENLRKLLNQYQKLKEDSRNIEIKINTQLKDLFN